MCSIRSISFLLLAACATAAAVAQAPPEPIRLNQVGFYPEAPKVAAAVGAPAGTFYVTTPDHADTVFTGTLGAPATWPASEETVRLADFSGLEAPGTYVVAVPGLGASHPFEVAPYVHQALARAALKAYYYQRASTELPERYAGRWARATGHPDTDVRVHPSAATDARPAGTRIAAPKGWYDAGDYNKYVVNSGISTGTLLMLYEHFPDYYADLDLDIPESGNGVPDLLDEVLWNLRWMLAMQDPTDGGVYHKLTTPNFEGAVMPGEARQPRYVVQKGTAATLDFAAVTALAARIYGDFGGELPGLADSLVSAAQAAWQWALEHPAVAYDQGRMNAQFEPDVVTGAYGDGRFEDEFAWAAAELYLTTADPSYLDRADPLDEGVSVPGWPNVGTLAYYSLAHHAAAAGAVDTAAVRGRLLAYADGLVDAWRSSAYGIVMGRSPGDFWWGSNSGAANEGMLLLQAYRLTGAADYLEAARSNLDYLLGRNATGYSFVTGYGDRTPMHIHHRPSEADGVADPVPGLLVGGPNPGVQDVGPEPWQCDDYRSTPAASYLDDWCSYASNEITINWNAPLAYLAGAIEAIRSPTGRPTPTAVEDGPGGAEGRAPGFGLVSFPNPAASSATATFELPRPATVSLTVYDVLGRVVARPVAARPLPAGPHTLAFDAGTLAGGAYVLRLDADGVTAARPLLVAR